MKRLHFIAKVPSLSDSFVFFSSSLLVRPPSATNFSILVTGTNCNELGGEAGVGCIPTRPASAYQVHTKNNRHTPVMVYDDLMIRNNTVLDYNTNRSRPVTVQ